MAYDPTVTALTPEEHELASAVFDLIEIVRHEYTADEDPGVIDLDDVIAIVTKSPSAVIQLFNHFSKPGVNLASDLEAAAHGVARNLRVLGN